MILWFVGWRDQRQIRMLRGDFGRARRAPQRMSQLVRHWARTTRSPPHPSEPNVAAPRAETLARPAPPPHQAAGDSARYGRLAPSAWAARDHRVGCRQIQCARQLQLGEDRPRCPVEYSETADHSSNTVLSTEPPRPQPQQYRRRLLIAQHERAAVQFHLHRYPEPAVGGQDRTA
jgi:hypothetical protein